MNMGSYCTLDMLRRGETAHIIGVSDALELRGRLADIGLSAGSEVKCLYESPSGCVKAYLIKGSVFALREGDCKDISVKAESRKSS